MRDRPVDHPFSHPGAAPRLAMVPVSQIYVDHNYQRDVKGRLVERILKGFSWAKFGAVVLAEQADGRYSVVEGQHRLKAAEMHPLVDAVPAVIVSMTGMADEAQNFLSINRDRMAVTAIEQYWAGVTAGDETCLRIAKVLKAAGCDVVAEQGDSAPNLTNAVGAMRRALGLSGDEAVRRALMIIRGAWPKDAKALKGTLITAVARLVRVNPKMIDSEVAASLAGQSFAQLTAHAEQFRKLSGGSAEATLARTICEIANRGKRTNILYYADGKS